MIIIWKRILIIMIIDNSMDKNMDNNFRIIWRIIWIEIWIIIIMILIIIIILIIILKKNINIIFLAISYNNIDNNHTDQII